VDTKLAHISCVCACMDCSFVGFWNIVTLLMYSQFLIFSYISSNLDTHYEKPFSLYSLNLMDDHRVGVLDEPTQRKRLLMAVVRGSFPPMFVFGTMDNL
jgi:hypothetical protein